MYDVAYRRRRSPALILFLIGLFSLTQVKIGGKIGISEFFMVISSPFLFFKDLSSLKRDGFLTMINLALLWLVGAAFSDWMNGSVFDQSIRGLSVPVVIFSTVVVIHHFLRDDIRDCKWLLLGLACSLVLSTFVFQRGTAGDMAAEGDMAGAVQKVVGYKLFWSNQIKTWFSLPVQTMYLRMPFAMSMICVSVVVVASLLRGGRSAFLFALMSLVLLVMGRKNINAMRNVKKHIVRRNGASIVYDNEKDFTEFYDRSKRLSKNDDFSPALSMLAEKNIVIYLQAFRGKNVFDRIARKILPKEKYVAYLKRHYTKKQILRILLALQCEEFREVSSQGLCNMLDQLEAQHGK